MNAAEHSVAADPAAGTSAMALMERGELEAYLARARRSSIERIQEELRDISLLSPRKFRRQVESPQEAGVGYSVSAAELIERGELEAYMCRASSQSVERIQEELRGMSLLSPRKERPEEVQV